MEKVGILNKVYPKDLGLIIQAMLKLSQDERINIQDVNERLAVFEQRVSEKIIKKKLWNMFNLYNVKFT